MIDTQRFTSFLIIVATLIVVPGPSVLFVVGRGVSLGRRAAVFTALGNESAMLVQVIAVACGLGFVVDRSAGGVPVQFLVLGLICVAIALVSDVSWGLLAGTARTWLARSPRRLSAIGGASGAVMMGLGLKLAASRRP
ncbi:hypothetical protein ND748_27340 [Frankia sp. AiPs1]|uniref:LysE family translocator n=1 Tax=Frankia sp. AiPs1 TaxID=573493 RepID=UPI0020446151|nr:hypothetical protein [Frankia sp. AiPs1]MCM3925369.1 hypothetical protein [Frankia sp. AiPs1]